VYSDVWADLSYLERSGGPFLAGIIGRQILYPGNCIGEGGRGRWSGVGWEGGDGGARPTMVGLSRRGGRRGAVRPTFEESCYSSQPRRRGLWLGSSGVRVRKELFLRKEFHEVLTCLSHDLSLGEEGTTPVLSHNYGSVAWWLGWEQVEGGANGNVYIICWSALVGLQGFPKVRKSKSCCHNVNRDG
jgi:hypothetical protein